MTLSVFQLALIMRLVRSEMLEVLRADYIKFARARGQVQAGAGARVTVPDDRILVPAGGVPE